MKRIDLHAHTTHSDGTLTPTELVERARDVGLSALAVTDHDTTSPLAEARTAAAGHDLEILSGCEVTAAGGRGVVHVLVYAYDEDHADFKAMLELVRAGRAERNRAIHERLEELGFPLDAAEVASLATGRIVARPHFAQAMVKRGYVDDIREAFDRFLRDGGPAAARAPVPTAEEVIEISVRAGAIPVLAHPRSLRLTGRAGHLEAFGRMRDAGLIGVEVDHPSHDGNRRRLYADVSEELGLVRSGGSDFHGATKPHIELGSGDGTIEVGYDTWERLLAARDGGARSA